MNQLEHKYLHLVPGISGSGKTTMCRALEAALCAEGLGAQVVVPHTTRPPRRGEIDGYDYHFHDSVPILGDGWRASCIGQHHYFNSDQETLPDTATPIKILPVAYGALAEVIDDYARPDIRITVTPIVINDEAQERWLESVAPQRPTRDLRRELSEQARMVREAYPFIDEIFYPTWTSRDDDVGRYVGTARALLQATREGILRRAL